MLFLFLYGIINISQICLHFTLILYRHLTFIFYEIIFQLLAYFLGVHIIIWINISISISNISINSRIDIIIITIINY